MSSVHTYVSPYGKRANARAITNKRFGYASKEEFIIDAVQRRLRILSGDYKLVKLPKQKYEELESAIRKMNLPFPNAADFIRKQIKQKKSYSK